jgi:hypothetical protein
LKNLVFERGGQRQLVGQLFDLQRDTLLNQRQQEAFLATEITMDDTFRAARVRGYLSGASGLVAAARK